LLHPGQLEGKGREAGCSLEVAGGVQVGGWAGGSPLAMVGRWRTSSALSATKRMTGVEINSTLFRDQDHTMERSVKSFFCE
jgi:hypothetical protein